VPEIRRCQQCGRLIPAGRDECPECSFQVTVLRPFSRKALIVGSFLLLVLFFFVAAFATRVFHATERELGESWFERGESYLKAKKPDAALDAFRTALRYSPDNSFYQLRLAQALISNHQPVEARAYLLNLWERDPQSGPVNHELGRLSAEEGDVREAIRYYHNAIYGDWPTADENRRHTERLEIYQFLKNHGAMEQAEAELIALSGEVPRDAKAHEQIGELLLANGDRDHALKEFQLALEVNPRLEPALSGAGGISFQTGQYSKALHYLTRAVAANPRDAKAKSLLETTTLVLALDPFEARLSIGEKSRRTARAFQTAMDRLKECADEREATPNSTLTANDLEGLYAQGVKLTRQARESALARNPDSILSTMDFVFRAEEAATKTCGRAAGADRALEVIGERRGGPS
jgi:tetratricopeptide (TPR) repeat protein